MTIIIIGNKEKKKKKTPMNTFATPRKQKFSFSHLPLWSWSICIFNLYTYSTA